MPPKKVSPRATQRQSTMTPSDVWSHELESAPVTKCYSCTGNFQADFTELCHAANMIVVPSVVQRPETPVLSERKISEKRYEIGKKDSARKSLWVKAKESLISVRGLSESSFVSDRPSQMRIPRKESEAEPDTFKPTTFTLKDRFQCFKPRVQVEFSESGELGTVTEIYIRDWKIDATMMGILKQCLPTVGYLHLLHLWNVGLNPETLDILLSFLPRCQELISLTLDANPLGNANVSNLINVNDSNLEELSLRFCELNDIHAHGIGMALGTTKTWNKKLLSLNLSNNKIGDVGACQIAHGLKTNRTLLTLNLAGNQIGDEGATALAETLSQFPLDDEQMRERRLKTEAKLVSEAIPAAVKQHYSADVDSKSKRMGKEKTVAISLPERRKTSKDLTPVTRWHKALPLHSLLAATRKDKKSSKLESPSTVPKVPRRRLKSKKPTTEYEMEWHPLMDAGNLYEGKFWVLGNRSLISLNLSRNRIEEKGLSQLLEMVKVQAVPCHEQQQTGTGLKRLVVNRNAVARDNTTLQALNHLMLTKDPMYRMPFVGLDRTNVPPCAMPPITI